MSIPLPHVPVGGRLRFFFDEWTKITSDPFILQMVQGMDISFEDFPDQKFVPTPLTFTSEESTATDHLIQELLDKRAIIPCEHEDNEFISTIFLRRKSNGKFRLILNLKFFNFFVFYCKFKMDTLIKLLALIVPEMYMGTLDLSDAYLTVAMSLFCQSFLKFFWKGKLFKFVAMPFGLTEAPRKFTKLCKPPLAVIRQAGFTISAYLDDFFQCELTFERCAEAICFSYNTLVSLGFLPNDEKSTYVPTQIIQSLGHIINSVSMTVSLPPSKTEAIISLCHTAIKNPTFSIRHLCTIIGKLISCFVAHPLGRLHYRSMERLKVSQLKTSKGNFETTVSLTPTCLQDLHWWLATLPFAQAPINRGNCTAVFTCDASEKGWSADFDSTRANGRFSLLEMPFSTNTKEILAVLFGLRSHIHNFVGQHILIMSDSTTAISVVKKMGSMGSLVHDNLARDIWDFAQQHGVWISITHIPGKVNSESDHGSRFFNTNLEWSLPPSTFDKLLHVFRDYGPFVMDLFASRLNYKIFPYVSFQPDPYCCHVDCFTMAWDSQYSYYAYAPFSVLPKLLQKIRQDKAQVMVVFPLWPTQMWFSTLLSMIISPIALLPTDPPVFQPGTNEPHPLNSQAMLSSAILSGEPSEPINFQRTWLTSSLTPSLQSQKRSLLQNSVNGKNFVWNGKLIPCVQI